MVGPPIYIWSLLWSHALLGSCPFLPLYKSLAIKQAFMIYIHTYVCGTPDSILFCFQTDSAVHTIGFMLSQLGQCERLALILLLCSLCRSFRLSVTELSDVIFIFIEFCRSSHFNLQAAKKCTSFSTCQTQFAPSNKLILLQCLLHSAKGLSTFSPVSRRV